MALRNSGGGLDLTKMRGQTVMTILPAFLMLGLALGTPLGGVIGALSLVPTLVSTLQTRILRLKFYYVYRRFLWCRFRYSITIPGPERKQLFRLRHLMILGLCPDTQGANTYILTLRNLYPTFRQVRLK